MDHCHSPKEARRHHSHPALRRTGLADCWPRVLEQAREPSLHPPCASPSDHRVRCKGPTPRHRRGDPQRARTKIPSGPRLGLLLLNLLQAALPLGGPRSHALCPRRRRLPHLRRVPALCRPCLTDFDPALRRRRHLCQRHRDGRCAIRAHRRAGQLTGVVAAHHGRGPPRYQD